MSAEPTSRMSAEYARRHLLLLRRDIELLAGEDETVDQAAAEAAAVLRYGSLAAVRGRLAELLAAGFSQTLVTATILIDRGWTKGAVTRLLGSEKSYKCCGPSPDPGYRMTYTLYPAVVALELEKLGQGLARQLKIDPPARLKAIIAARSALVERLESLAGKRVEAVVSDREAPFIEKSWQEFWHSLPEDTRSDLLASPVLLEAEASAFLGRIRAEASSRLFTRYVEQEPRLDLAALPLKEKEALLLRYRAEFRVFYAAGSMLAPDNKQASIDKLCQPLRPQKPVVVPTAAAVATTATKPGAAAKTTAPIDKWRETQIRKSRCSDELDPHVDSCNEESLRPLDDAEAARAEKALVALAAGFRRYNTTAKASRALAPEKLLFFAERVADDCHRRRFLRASERLHRVELTQGEGLSAAQLQTVRREAVKGLSRYLVPEELAEELADRLRLLALPVIAKTLGLTAAKVEQLH